MPTPKPSPRVANDANKAALTSALDKFDWLIKELRTFDVSGVRDRWDPSLESLQKRSNAALADTFGPNSPEYKKYAVDGFDAELDSAFNNRYSTEELQQAVKAGLEKAIVSLNGVKVLLNERARQQAVPAPAPTPAPARTPAPAAPAPAAAPARAPAAAPAAAPAPRPVVTPEPPVATRSSAASAASSNVRIAVVCHHDAHAREAALGFVAQLGLQAITLPEPPKATDSAFFDRLEHLSDPDFAIVVLAANASGTASDVPNALSPALLLELGFLMRALGRARICFLVAGHMAMAPPWEGVVRLPMDEAGTWRLLLARAMKQAGLDVDMNRAL